MNEKNDPTNLIIGGAIAVHRYLGPGLLESTYKACLAEELRCRNVQCETEVPVPVRYRGASLDCGYRIDLLVDEAVVVELKVARSVTDVHRAQLLSYMRLAGVPIGLLLNFNTRRLADGIVRMVL